MEPRWQLYDFVGAQIALPLRLQFPFRASGFVVTNNTPALLYLSRVVPNPLATNKDISVPPRQVQSINGWFTDQLNIGSDGTAIGASDSLSVQVTDSQALQQAAASTVTPSYRELQGRFEPNYQDAWGYYAGNIASVTGTHYSIEKAGYLTTGTINPLIANPVVTRPRTVQVVTPAANFQWGGMFGIGAVIGADGHRSYTPRHLGPPALSWTTAYIDCLINYNGAGYQTNTAGLFVGWIDSTIGYNTVQYPLNPGSRPNNLIGVAISQGVWHALAKRANALTDLSPVTTYNVATPKQITLRWRAGTFAYAFDGAAYTEMAPVTNIPDRSLIPCLFGWYENAAISAVFYHENFNDYWDVN